MLKKTLRSVLSVFLALAMLLGTCSTALAATIELTDDEKLSLKELFEMLAGAQEKEYDYVSLGASNTNGYGHLGYLPPEVSEDPLYASKADLNTYGYWAEPYNSYPVQIKNELTEVLGKPVDLHQLAISSMRVEELRFLLDESYIGDEYLDWRFYEIPEFNGPKSSQNNWFVKAGAQILKSEGKTGSNEDALNALRKDYQDSIKDAELITFDMGWNNFGVFAFNNIKTILDSAGDGDFYYAPDWDGVADVIGQADYEELKNMAMDYLAGSVALTDALRARVAKMADSLVYAAIGACYHYDIVMEKIYELNPDAKVVVINIQNLADDIVIEFQGEKLYLGDAYGKLIDFVNLYRATESPYADKCYYAHAGNEGDVETFLDEIKAWNGDPTTLTRDMKDLFDMYDDNLYVRSIVEYMMAGQALSGLFESIRNEAAKLPLDKLGLTTPFKNDSKYTYEFYLDMSWVLDANGNVAVDLGGLNLSNPTTDLEKYGAAVALHLKNIRGNGNFDAYDYVFDNLTATLESVIASQNLDKATLVGAKSQLEAGIAQLKVALNSVPEQNKPAIQEQISAYEAQLAQVNDGLMLFDAVEDIIPQAKAGFKNGLKAVYKTYHNTLNYAYDVVATYVQYAANIDSFAMDPTQMGNINAQSGKFAGAIFKDFLGGSMVKFQYELYANGLSAEPIPAVPDFVLDESIFDDPATRAIASLWVHFEIGSAFFAHPNVNGNTQIKNAVLNVLVNGSDAEDFKNANSDLAKIFELYKLYANRDEILAQFGDIDDLAVIFKILKMSNDPVISLIDLDSLEAQIRKAHRDFKESRTPEEAKKAQDSVADLLNRLYKIAALATGENYEVTEDSYYVSLGDSTITGYGLEGYIDNMLNGANQVVTDSAHVVFSQMIFGDNWKNQFGNFCQGSLRADDLLIHLGGNVEADLDDYYYAEIEPNLMEGTLEATQKRFIENVAKADLISVAIGGGNILTFVGKYMNRVMYPETYGEPYELDWDRIGYGEFAPTIDEINASIEKLVPIIDGMGLLNQYVPEGMPVEEPAKYARALAEGLLYGYASLNYYYTRVLERIQEINPDAHLLIIGLFNPVDAWSVTTQIEGEDVTLNIGGAIANIMSSANLVSLTYALMNENATFVDISEAETILEDEKGGELGFGDYFNGAFQSNGKAVHASVAGHKYIAEQMLDVLNTENKLIAIFGDVYDMIIEYYDDAYKYAYEYAAANGYVDSVIKAIDDAIGAIEALDFSDTQATDEFKALLNAELESIIEILEAAKELVANADELDDETFVKLIAVLGEAAEAMNSLADLAAQAGIDVNGLVIIPAIEEAIEYVVTVAIPAAKEAAKIAAEKAYEYIVEQLGVAYDRLVDAIVAAAEKYLPELDKALYDYLYNNPDEVIAFFAEYGDEIVALVEEYGDEALLVIAYVLYVYGDEVVEFVIENDEAILAIMVEWVDAYGEKAIALIQVYAEALGLCDAVREQISTLEEQIAALEAALANRVAAIEKEIADLKAQLESAVGAAKAEIEAKIAALEAELAAINAAIEAKIAEINAAIEALKAELEAAIASGLMKLDELKNAILALDDAVAELIEALKNVTEEAIIDALAKIDATVKALDAALYELASEKYEELKKALCEFAMSVLEQTIDAIVKFFPELDEALYNYFYNNPDEVIAFFDKYGDVMLDIANEYGLEALAVVGYVLYAYGEDIAAYVIENGDAILSAVKGWTEKYGERTAAMLQVYAEALGLCDAVREQIKTLEEQIAALEAALANRIAAIEKEIADLKAQLESAVGAAKAEIEAKIAALEAELAAIKAAIEEKIAEIKAAIEALKAELEAAIASGFMKLDELKNAILALDDAVAELIDSLKNVTAEAIIDALAKIDATIKALDAALYELASEKYEELKKALCEFAMSVLEQTIDAIVKFFPELDEALYNYFYNNPDEVIAFFDKYGDVMLDIANEYGLEALAVVGYVLYAYGEDIAAYVIENSDAILSAVKGWTEKYGERTAAMLQVYAEALGLCDAVREQIKTLEDILNELEAQLENAVGEAKALIEAKIAEVKAAIAELKAALDALEAAIKNIVTDVNAKVEAAIAKLEQAIRELNEKVEALIEETVNKVETAINDAIEAAVNELNALVNELINVVDSELKALVAKLIYDSTHGTYVIDRESLYVALGGSSVVTPSYVEYLAEMLDIDFEDLTGNPDMLAVVLENMELIANADLITLDYNTGVATDFAVSQALGFVKLYMNNVLRPQAKDYAYNVANIIFGDLYEGHEIMNVIPSVIDSKFEEMLANEVFASATYDELDWLSLVGEEGLPYVEKARAALVEKLIEAGVAETTIIPVNMVELLYSNIDAFGQYGWLLPNEDKLAAKLGDDAVYYIEIPTLDLVSYMAESYVYSLMLYNKQYTETIATIRAINPDALVVLLGHYNALNGLAFVEGDLEAVYEAYADVLSIYPFVHALLGENTVYVDIPETETLLGATVNGAQFSIEDFIMTYLNASIATQPSEAGQYYIYQQILNALTIIDTRGLLGDADGDGDVDSTDAMLILQYDALIIDETQLDLSVCDVDGDGDVDSTDAMYIVQYDGLLIDKLPAEK